VVKRDGRREPFDRAKVVSGIAKACKNRPVHDDEMRRICDEIEERARETTPERSGGANGPAIASGDIGDHVLARLKELDEVAYVRFASVHREFQDVKEFERVIAEFSGDPAKPVGGRG
jgi:transcriptional repressor NrdR